MRSEDRHFWKALDELIQIGREAGLPVQISHTKLAMKSSWGKAEQLIERLDQARQEGIEVTADIYPYNYWLSTLQVLFPERNFSDLEAARFATYEVTTPEGMFLGAYGTATELDVGRSLRDISTERGEAPEVTLTQLILDSIAYAEAHPDLQEPLETVMAISMEESDIRTPHAVALHVVLHRRRPARCSSARLWAAIHASSDTTCASAACSRSRKPSTR